MSARRILGLALLVGGLVLLYFGMNASESFASDVSEMVSGSPTDRSIWMLTGGGAASVAGAFLAFTPGGSR